MMRYNLYAMARYECELSFVARESKRIAFPTVRN